MFLMYSRKYPPSKGPHWKVLFIIALICLDSPKKTVNFLKAGRVIVMNPSVLLFPLYKIDGISTLH